MKNILIISSFLLFLFLGACSENSRNTETENCEVINIDSCNVILLGNEYNFDEIKCENLMLGGCKITFYNGEKKKVLHLREKYDFDEYRLSRIALWLEKYKEFSPFQMTRFNVYNNIERRLTINPEIKGIALELSNGRLIVLMSFKENSGLIKRTIAQVTPSPIFNQIIEGNEEQKETCSVKVYYPDARTTQWFILPIYHPTHTVNPKDQTLSPNIYKPQDIKKDEVKLFPCPGKSEITCETIDGGRSRICIKDTQNGTKEEIIINGKYNYTPQQVHKSRKGFTNEIVGGAFLSEDGKFYLLLQIPEDTATAKKIRTSSIIEYISPEYQKYNCYVRARVSLENRRGGGYELYELPVYLPQ